MPRSDGAAVTCRLFLVDLRLPETAAYAALLSADERARAAAYRLPGHAARFTVMRGTLRLLLAAAQNCAPGAVRIDAAVQGKPYTPAGPQFSVSYRDGIGVIALCDRTVGVDIELAANAGHIATAAAVAFSAAERDVIGGRAARARRDAWLQGWTRKEALVKAWGTGLGMQSADVPVALGAREAVCERFGKRWVTRDYAPAGAPWRIAVAVELPAGGVLRVTRTPAPAAASAAVKNAHAARKGPAAAATASSATGTPVPRCRRSVRAPRKSPRRRG